MRTVYGATQPRPNLAASAATASTDRALQAAVSSPAKPAPHTTQGLAAAASAASTLGAHIYRADLNVLQGHAMVVRGVIHPGLPGEAVALQVRPARRWHAVAGVLTGAGGRFNLHYLPRSLGSEPARLAITGNAIAGGPLVGGQCGAPICAPAPAGSPPVSRTVRQLGRLNVYRLAEASWYGGGGGLACGGELTSSTMGVANKTLPCGTLVTLRYGGRTVRVPVIDRGPFVPGREFDLTEATKNALNFPGLGPVWSTR